MGHLDRVNKYISKELELTICLTDGEEFWFYRDNKWYFLINISFLHDDKVMYNQLIIEEYSNFFSISKDDVIKIFFDWIQDNLNLMSKRMIPYCFGIYRATKYYDWEEIQKNCIEVNPIEFFQKVNEELQIRSIE